MTRYRFKRYIFIGILIVVILLYYLCPSRSIVNNALTEEPKASKELRYYEKTIREQCSNYHDKENKLNSNPNLSKYFRRPKCLNLLENLSKGKWVRAERYNYSLEQELNEIHLNFRRKVGISPTPWRNDGQCGYEILTKQITNEWPQTGTFCNPNSPESCCTNINKGMCIASTRCNCPACVDTSKYRDALLSKWMPDDPK